MIELIKQHLKYEFKENKEEYKDRYFDNIIEVEENLIYYCNILTGYSAYNEGDAINKIQNFINDMDIEDVFSKLKKRGLFLTDTVIENEEFSLYISSKDFNPRQLFEMLNEKKFKDYKDFIRFFEDLKKRKFIFFQLDKLQLNQEMALYS